MKYELYKFMNGENVWYCTSSARKKTFPDGGNIYVPVSGLERSNIEDAGIDKCEIDVTLSYPQIILNTQNHDFAALFKGRIFTGKTYITIIEVDDDGSQVIFNGRITSAPWDRDSKVLTLKCATGEADHENQVNTRKHQRTCPNAIYDRWCGLKFEDWLIEAQITSVSGTTIGFAVTDEQTVIADYLRLGMLKKDGFRITITSNSTNTVALFHKQHGLKVGDYVQLAPGCNKSIEMCSERYSNHTRHGGSPNIPNSNPVGSQLMK